MPDKVRIDITIDDNEAQIWMDSYHLAKNKNLNLLVDDRTIQAVSLNDDNFETLANAIDGDDIMLIAQGNLQSSAKMLIKKLVRHPKLAKVMLKYLK